MTLARLARDAARRVRDADLVTVVSDNDADGIAAGAIIAAAFRRAGVPFHLRCSGRPEPDHWKELESAGTIVFADMGSGQLDRIEALPGHAVILDHHQVARPARTATQVNPNLEGEDGTVGCCASTLAYLFAVGLDDANDDLGAIALAGVVGDRQHMPEPRGENARMFTKLAKAGVVSVEPGLPFRPGDTLERALAGATDPYLAGVSGRARNARAFVEGLGLRPDARVAELDGPARQRLASGVVLHLLERGVHPDVARETVRARWRLASPAGLEAGELADLLNACGRLGEAGVGVSAALGDPAALARARRHLEGYNERIIKGLVKLEAAPPKRLTAIQVFDAPDPEMAGTHCGLGIAYVFPKDLPAVSLARFDPRLKVSGRATMELVGRGVDLADAFKTAAEELGGDGGGHPVAAGATIQEAQRDTFVRRVDEIVAGQVTG